MSGGDLPVPKNQSLGLLPPSRKGAKPSIRPRACQKGGSRDTEQDQPSVPRRKRRDTLLRLNSKKYNDEH